MDDYAGRVLADRYRLPLPPSDEYELVETRAFDTYSGQEVLVRQVPLPEVVDAEVVETDGLAGSAVPRRAQGRTARRPTDPAVRRAIEAAQAAAQIPDHPRLDQVFDVFAEGGLLWIVSERVAARPLAALLADKPLSPYRAAEVASDVLTALRVLHAHGWTHRNITSRTVLVCDDGRVVLTGLASGAAEEALCGYAPVPGPRTSRQGFRGRPRRPRRRGLPWRRRSTRIRRTGTGTGTGTQTRVRTAARTKGRTGLRPALGSPCRGPEPACRTPGPRGRVRSPRTARAHGPRRAPHEDQRDGDRPVQAGFDPDWWARRPGEPGPDLDMDDDSDDVEEDGGWSGPGRVRLAGTWHDGAFPAQDGPRPLPAGGSPGTPIPGSHSTGGSAARGHNDPYGTRPALPGPRTDNVPTARHGGTAQDALRADAQRADVQRRPVVAEVQAPTGRWDEIVAGGSTPAYRGPATPLAAERARQARIAVVGAVTERWAPEQAGPVHENWQLAAPIGPATDLWALGALLYRAVQGHAPYPEESAVELVQLVCSEPPAFAEECGPLRPVVESLLRQDPTERPDFEELRGWLRSLVRSAPEPEAGMDVVPVPSAAVDGSRLPVVRRRGELVRKRRGSAEVVHGRHRHKKSKRERGGPRSLGRSLLLLILLLLVAAVAYAVLFMPKADSQQRDRSQGTNGGRPPHDQSEPGPRHHRQPAVDSRDQPRCPAAPDLRTRRESPVRLRAAQGSGGFPDSRPEVLAAPPDQRRRPSPLHRRKFHSDRRPRP